MVKSRNPVLPKGTEVEGRSEDSDGWWLGGRRWGKGRIGASTWKPNSANRVDIGHKEIRKQLATGISCHGNCGHFILFSNHEYLPSQRMNFSFICLWRSKSAYLSVKSENLLWAWGKCHELIAQLDYDRQLFHDNMSPPLCRLYGVAAVTPEPGSWQQDVHGPRRGMSSTAENTAMFLNLTAFAG